MRLTEFRICNYRSINDTGWVPVGKLTSLVGRNESGKTNVLQALKTLNPPGGPVDLNKTKDFPRHRRLSECLDDTEVVATRWALSGEERIELGAIYPRAASVEVIEVGRCYKATPITVEFLPLSDFSDAADGVRKTLQELDDTLRVHATELDQALDNTLNQTLQKLVSEWEKEEDTESWAISAAPSLAALRKTFADSGSTIPQAVEQHLLKIEGIVKTYNEDARASQKARIWVQKRLPVFSYVSEYPELKGHQNIADFLTRRASNQTNDADANFEKMCRVAGIDPQELQELHGKGDHETRNQLANRAGAVVTAELRRLWKDRELKVRFSPDAQHFDTYISDPNSLYDVEVNLDERSRGLKWFFSFYITFAADTQGGSAESAILLLDEPGLYLHALSQADLLRHLDSDFKNQIIYTTHSPFMVPTELLDAIRTVNIDQEAGTTVTATPSGDSRTLFPLQMALGYSLSQSLFVGSNNLIVEGVTDYWYLSTASEFLASKGHPSLPNNLTITPAGGAQKVGYMVALLSSERLRVLLLLDEEHQARKSVDDLIKSKLIVKKSVLFASEAFATPPTEADIEDILDESVFEKLVAESYKKELKGKTLKLNSKIPRIVKRYEDAFDKIGVEFHKTRPARLFLKMMADAPDSVIFGPSKDRFVKLFEIISEAHTHLISKPTNPFGT